jgi:tetratricopeptide (TPR) repeat protein
VLQNEDTHIASLERAAEIRLSQFVMQLHRLTRVHEYRKAFDLIQIFQKENHNNLDEHLYARLCEWDDKRLTAMLGADLAERLLRDGEAERALKIFRDSYDMDPIKFAFSSGTSSLLFCNVAKDRASQERLFKYLQRFDQTFPNHPSLPAAMLQLATLALDRFSDPKIAREALAKVATYSPAITESQEYRRLMALCSA